jgi:hypothetical protein
MVAISNTGWDDLAFAVFCICLAAVAIVFLIVTR